MLWSIALRVVSPVMMFLLLAACSSETTSTSSGSHTSSGAGGGTTTTTTTTTTGSSGGCSLPKCTSTSECAFQPCMTTDSGTDYCYPQAASASECPSGNTAVTVTANGMQTIVCVPTGCPQPMTYVP